MPGNRSGMFGGMDERWRPDDHLVKQNRSLQPSTSVKSRKLGRLSILCHHPILPKSPSRAQKITPNRPLAVEFEPRIDIGRNRERNGEMSALGLIGSGAPTPERPAQSIISEWQLHLEEALASTRRMWIRGRFVRHAGPQADLPIRRRWWTRKKTMPGIDGLGPPAN